ncbi:MAG: type II toxin-antitoxin system PemK/MazF family toxin [Bacillota bacterium]|nr:type II toxin-antitoxin system PemK/MazF family toxin [Bacillota bacterium]
MGGFVKGDVVVVPFPFSDLTNSKKRPAFVCADLDGDDLILAQITSQSTYDNYAVLIQDDDFQEGSLRKTSNVRTNKIFTADQEIVLYKIGCLNRGKIEEITHSIIGILST